MSQEIAEHVTTFIRARFRVTEDDEVFGPDVHLFEEGYVDSAGVIELIAYIEESLHVTLPDDILFAERFVTIRGIAEIVQAARDRASSSAEPTVRAPSAGRAREVGPPPL